MSNLKPTNDFVFKKLFGEEKNVDILKDLIQSILPELQIAKVVVNKDVSLERKLITDKLGILDVMATLNDNTKINIEMQVEDLHNTIERSIFYQSGVYHESLAKGVSYINAFKTIGIWITNYDVFKEGPFHEIARLKRDYENIILTDKYELHYIQLSKFKKKCKRISTKLEQWLLFIINENMEEINMVDNKYVKKAEKELEYLSGDEETRRLAELREKAIRDELAAIAQARDEGKSEGFSLGKSEGFSLGISKGKSEGIIEGESQNTIKIAKKMLEKQIDIALIMEITGLTKEEIKKL